jgi:glycosyltransferase involved in cell wall biosynthesis
MNLLILGYELPPIGGGTGRSLWHLLQAWPRDAGWEIEVWTAAPPVREPRPLPPFVHLEEFSCWKGDLHYWRVHEMALLLWKAWRKSLDDSYIPDAILVWGAWPLAPLLLSSLGVTPSIIALRGSDVPGFNPRTTGAFWKHLAASIWSRAAMVTANSPSLVTMAKHTARNTPMEVIPNGVIIPEGTTIRSLPVDFIEGKRPFRVLSVSRLIPRKRLEWLVEAMSIIPPDARSSLEVTIAGDGPERYRLETMVQELDLGARFHFPGVVSNDRMNRLYRDSDLFVHTSMAEGLSNALLEAMASGLPCLCAEPTGFEDLDGAVIPVGSVGKLASNILSMMTNPEAYSEFSFASLAAASHYTWESVAYRYIDLLSGLGKRS